jgi:hypothetical protein
MVDHFGKVSSLGHPKIEAKHRKFGAVVVNHVVVLVLKSPQLLCNVLPINKNVIDLLLVSCNLCVESCLVCS